MALAGTLKEADITAALAACKGKPHENDTALFRTDSDSCTKTGNSSYFSILTHLMPTFLQQNAISNTESHYQITANGTLKAIFAALKCN